MHQVGFGVVEAAAGGADFEDGRIVGVAARQQRVDVFSASFDGGPGEGDALLLHHDLIDGAFDLGRGELLGIGVEHRKLAATNV